MHTATVGLFLATLLLAGSGCDAMHSYVLRGQVVRADWQEVLAKARQASAWSDDPNEGDVPLDLAGVPAAELTLAMNPFGGERTEIRRTTTDERGHFELRADVFGGPTNPVKDLRFRIVRDGFEPWEGTFRSGDFYFNSSGGITLEAMAGVRYLLIPLGEALGPSRGDAGQAPDAGEGKARTR